MGGFGLVAAGAGATRVAATGPANAWLHGILGATDTSQAEGGQHHRGSAQHKHQPALEVMQCAFGHARAPMVHGDADEADAQAVHEHGDGDARQKDDDALPHRPAVKISDDEGQGHERKQVAQSAAGLGDFQLVTAQIDDIAFEQHADAGGTDHPHAQLGGQQLQMQGQ
jgi:hypothetical protein